MERPRSFVQAMPATSPMQPQMPQGAGCEVETEGMMKSMMKSAYGKSLAAFMVAYIGLSMAPQAWPLEKLYSVTDEQGVANPKKRALVSAVLATIVFYLANYIN